MIVSARVSVVNCIALGRRLLMVLALFGLAGAAHAAEVRLRDDLRPSAAPIASMDDGWDWLSVRDPRGLDELPADWRLLVDQVRFQEIGIVVANTNGRQSRIFRGADGLQQN